MSVDRLDRVNSLLKRVVADAIFRVFQNDDVNPGMITVTRVACSKNLRNATVYVSVFGDDALQRRAIGHLVHHTHEFERTVNREVRMKFTPQIRFELDHSIEMGDRVLAILDRLGGDSAPSVDYSATPEVE